MTRPERFFSIEQSRDVSEILKAVAHPLRLRIIDNLEKGELCVGEIAQRTGKGQAIISQQLKNLRMVGLVKVQRRGGKSYYCIDNTEVNDLLSCLRRCTGEDDLKNNGDREEGV